MKSTMKNFNFLILALIVGIGFSACSKDKTEYYDPQKWFDLERPVLANYVDSVPELKGAVADSSGIYYVVMDPGLQDSTDNDFYHYNINNANEIEVPRIRVNYVGQMVPNGVEFDKGNDKEFLLTTTVGAWQKAFLPKYIMDKQGKLRYNGIGMGITEFGLQKGAKVRIVLPSYYGYQDRTVGSIPANTPLDFYIEVLEVNPPSAKN